MYAERSQIAMLIASAIFIVGTPLLFIFGIPIKGAERNTVAYIFGGFLLIPIIAYGMIRKQDDQRVWSFNSLKLKGRNRG